ncbi:(2Fe-2S)-binding protein [Compostimonas suwonensis]|uniref:2Fe-2S iron-sulfur cluster protein n=1 Tax=Compostimonas suwonensis TaxID=1048394 RepID=A0A2M9C5A7_9MICO|nr:(2Fe-2S)-binding protein [Compostimonas suwonensis]PJJ65679.1 2Fe-2S iron-sulfur cluster protein [Compostimonas suwonensis]
MTARRLPPSADPIEPGEAGALSILVDGRPLDGLRGQTIAGVLLASGELAWRRTSVAGAPRGLFCGIGVCFDCIVTVNGERDIRACQRRAVDGDLVEIQHDELPELPGLPELPANGGARS